jgi:hypothetical protein
MNPLRQAAQQALEALEFMADEWGFTQKANRPERWQAIDALRAALAQQEQEVKGCDHCNHPLYAAIKCRVCGRVTKEEPVAWVSVTDALPKSGVTVLACYRNRLGKLRRIRAHWIAAKTAEANSEDWDQCSEYDEATDTYYVTEGWYECIDNWGDYSAVAVSEGDVTHWMPLPEAPQEVVA